MAYACKGLSSTNKFELREENGPHLKSNKSLVADIDKLAGGDNQTFNANLKRQILGPTHNIMQQLIFTLLSSRPGRVTRFLTWQKKSNDFV